MEKKKKVGRPAKFVVRLTPEERTRLEGMIRCGKGAARVLMKARILLKADVSENGSGWSDQRISGALVTQGNRLKKLSTKLLFGFSRKFLPKTRNYHEVTI